MVIEERGLEYFIERESGRTLHEDLPYLSTGSHSIHMQTDAEQFLHQGPDCASVL